MADIWTLHSCTIRASCVNINLKNVCQEVKNHHSSSVTKTLASAPFTPSHDPPPDNTGTI